MEKKFILITSPPACGKTRLAKRLAKELNNVVYLDKDSLIPLSKQIFKVAHKPYNRSSAFFYRFIRDYEYEVIINQGVEALKFAETVIINAPFRKEVRDLNYIQNFKNRVEKIGAKLLVVWIESTPEQCHYRMKKRNSDRDRWKLSHWDEYVQTVDFSVPPLSEEDLFVYKNSNEEETEDHFSKLMERIKK